MTATATSIHSNRKVTMHSTKTLTELGGSLIAKDDRAKALRDGLLQLGIVQLDRLVAHLDDSAGMVTDEVHHDARTGLWCPLAVALDVATLVETEAIRVGNSETAIKDLIVGIGRESISGFGLNPISGVRGSSYTTERVRDLHAIALAIRADASEC